MWTPTPWEYQDDWYTGFFQTGTTLRNNVSITGGNGKGTSGRLSFTDTRNNASTPDTGFLEEDGAGALLTMQYTLDSTVL